MEKEMNDSVPRRRLCYQTSPVLWFTRTVCNVRMLGQEAPSSLSTHMKLLTYTYTESVVT